MDRIPTRPQRLARRIAWLLRANRVLAADGQWAQAKRFASVLERWAGAESRISRWETGRTRPPPEVIDRYEKVLELPPGLLRAAVATATRFATTPGGRHALIPHDQLTPDVDPLIEQALSSELMSGDQWDALTSAVAANPMMLIAPRSARSALVERLLQEMIIAHGVPWQQRFESLNRLLIHPSFELDVIDACASLAADPSNQVFIETIGVLDGTTHSEAGRAVVGQLTAPTNERALRGALTACIRKARFRHFSPEQLTVVLAKVRELRGSAVFQSETEAILGGLRLEQKGEAAASDPSAHRLAQATRLAARLTAASVEAFNRDVPPAVHEQYADLVAEILGHPNPDARLYTAMLVAASPYRRPLARAITDRLSGADQIPMELRVRLVAALRAVGGQDERPAIEEILIGRKRLPDIEGAAAFAIGHLGGRSAPAFWLRALELHTQSWHENRSATAAATLSGLVYSLGVARQRKILSLVCDDAAAPAPARTAAQWWTNIADSTYLSAER